MPRDGTHRFSATVKIDGINPYVVVPARTVAALGIDHPQAVRLRLERASGARPAQKRGAKLARDAAQLIAIGRLTADAWFRTTLVRQRTTLRVYLDTWMREDAGVAVGDRVRLTLKADTASRELAIPAPLHQALGADTNAMAAWNALPPSRRREILTYLTFLKTPAALERNVRKVIGQLRGSTG